MKLAEFACIRDLASAILAMTLDNEIKRGGIVLIPAHFGLTSSSVSSIETDFVELGYELHHPSVKIYKGE